MNIGVTGKSGEDRVADFLIKQGAKVIYRNFVCKKGEIDIIAEMDSYIVFVEVKTRKQNAMAKGRAAVDPIKQQRCLAAAREFIAKTSCDLPPRFDVAEVTVLEKESKKEYNLNYIKNAF